MFEMTSAPVRRRPPSKMAAGHLPFLVVLVSFLGLTGCGRPGGQATTANEPIPTTSDIFGKVIHFDASHEADPYKVSGWSPTERNFTWTIGKAAVIAIPVPPNSGPLRLRMLVSAYTHPPELVSQPVEVYANGEKVADWNVTGLVYNVADIPKEVANKNTTLTVQFRTPKAASPAEFSAKGDDRVLGICCTEMELRKLSAP